MTSVAIICKDRVLRLRTDSSVQLRIAPRLMRVQGRRRHLDDSRIGVVLLILLSPLGLRLAPRISHVRLVQLAPLVGLGILQHTEVRGSLARPPYVDDVPRSGCVLPWYGFQLRAFNHGRLRKLRSSE